MSAARTAGTIGWVQVGSDDPEATKSFYGGLFDWTYEPDPNGGGAYDLITFPGAERPGGGIMHTGGRTPNHAIFFVVVPDVAATVAEAERLGAKVGVPVTNTPTGLVFAELLDPSGNHFGVFTPPGS